MEPSLVETASRPAAALTDDLLHRIDAWWRAANYLAVGQIYLLDNPLLGIPLALEHIKPRLLGHWGTTPGLNLLYAHLNRIITQYDCNMIFIAGPGHGGPAVVASTWLEGSYSERYPDVSQDEQGLRRLFRQFSFPGGIPSHAAPQTPGSIHEGGELGYSMAHAFGAVFDRPDLIAACVIGDGEAETGALATSWHSNKFLNPVRDGAVLPILHLNGYKIAGPTVLARISREELEHLLRGYGYEPAVVEGADPFEVHHALANALDAVIARIRAVQSEARHGGFRERPRWPMIVLRTPKGWTGPGVVDGLQIEGTFRAHQVPLGDFAAHPEHIALLEQWMRSYRPGEVFDGAGRVRADILSLAPRGDRRMGANPVANGGALLRELRVPDLRQYAVPVTVPGAVAVEATHVQGTLMRDVLRNNPDNFRVFSPDETSSNRWQPVFEVTSRCSVATVVPDDDHVSPDGRVMEMLSEHQCQGWLEGYLLTGRHGFFSCYEAFAHIVDSMFNQHAKWLDAASRIPWRRPIASLNYLLSSHVWRQDHNGFSHQDPGMLDVVVNKKSAVVRVYLPPDANALLAVTAHCLRSRNFVNVIVAGKNAEPQWLDLDAAEAHCQAGASVWSWAGTEGPRGPDVVMACCGDVPTIETLAAVMILRQRFPELGIRVVNVVDLMCLEPPLEHPHGLSDATFDALFPPGVPTIFAFHGYPWLIHRLTYRRHNHDDLHVRGYKEFGTTTTPFDMVVLNDLDRFHLALDAVVRVPLLAPALAEMRSWVAARIAEHTAYIHEHGEDLPEIQAWRWTPA